jgi:hypothetical protein
VEPRRIGRARLAATRTAALALTPMVLLLACSGSATRGDSDTTRAASRPSSTAAPLPVFHRDDMLWLERVTFGLDTASVADYRRLGRERFLDRQLQNQATVPPPIATEIESLEVSHAEPARWLAEVNARYKTINANPRRAGQRAGAQNAERSGQQARV